MSDNHFVVHQCGCVGLPKNPGTDDALVFLDCCEGVGAHMKGIRKDYNATVPCEQKRAAKIVKDLGALVMDGLAYRELMAHLQRGLK